jgi:hypothetical protein
MIPASPFTSFDIFSFAGWEIFSVPDKGKA